MFQSIKPSLRRLVHIPRKKAKRIAAELLARDISFSYEAYRLQHKTQIYGQEATNDSNFCLSPHKTCAGTQPSIAPASHSQSPEVLALSIADLIFHVLLSDFPFEEEEE